MLKKILLVRHAESREDVNPNLRLIANDEDITLTSQGRGQVAQLARKIAADLNCQRKIRVLVAPSCRTRSTVELLSSFFPSTIFDTRVVSAIRTLDWGVTDKYSIKEIEKARYRVGVLFFNFPGGDRTPRLVSEVEKTVHRLMLDGRADEHPECVMVCAHGFTFRLVAKSLLGMSNREFQYLANPPNAFCSHFVIRNGRVTLEGTLPTVYFKT